jgi:hypothetical protein
MEMLPPGMVSTKQVMSPPGIVSTKQVRWRKTPVEFDFERNDKDLKLLREHLLNEQKRYMENFNTKTECSARIGQLTVELKEHICNKYNIAAIQHQMKYIMRLKDEMLKEIVQKRESIASKQKVLFDEAKLRAELIGDSFQKKPEDFTATSINSDHKKIKSLESNIPIIDRQYKEYEILITLNHKQLISETKQQILQYKEQLAQAEQVETDAKKLIETLTKFIAQKEMAYEYHQYMSYFKLRIFKNEDGVDELEKIITICNKHRQYTLLYKIPFINKSGIMTIGYVFRRKYYSHEKCTKCCPGYSVKKRSCSCKNTTNMTLDVSHVDFSDPRQFNITTLRPCGKLVLISELTVQPQELPLWNQPQPQTLEPEYIIFPKLTIHITEFE